METNAMRLCETWFLKNKVLIIIIELILLLLILLLSDFPEVCPLETCFQNKFWLYLPPYLFQR